jgi:hypothetical protein
MHMHLMRVAYTVGGMKSDRETPSPVARDTRWRIIE